MSDDGVFRDCGNLRAALHCRPLDVSLHMLCGVSGAIALGASYVALKMRDMGLGGSCRRLQVYTFARAHSCGRSTHAVRVQPAIIAQKA